MNKRNQVTPRKSNHAVGEVYKPHSDLNIHDPDNKYRWQDEEANAPAWVWGLRILGGLVAFVGFYFIAVLTFLF